jgi:hypothetical protein
MQLGADVKGDNLFFSECLSVRYVDEERADLET